VDTNTMILIEELAGNLVRQSIETSLASIVAEETIKAAIIAEYANESAEELSSEVQNEFVTGQKYLTMLERPVLPKQDTTEVHHDEVSVDSFVLHLEHLSELETVFEAEPCIQITGAYEQQSPGEDVSTYTTELIHTQIQSTGSDVDVAEDLSAVSSIEIQGTEVSSTIEVTREKQITGLPKQYTVEVYQDEISVGVHELSLDHHESLEAVAESEACAKTEELQVAGPVVTSLHDIGEVTDYPAVEKTVVDKRQDSSQIGDPELSMTTPAISEVVVRRMVDTRIDNDITLSIPRQYSSDLSDVDESEFFDRLARDVVRDAVESSSAQLCAQQLDVMDTGDFSTDQKKTETFDICSDVDVGKEAGEMSFEYVKHDESIETETYDSESYVSIPETLIKESEHDTTVCLEQLPADIFERQLVDSVVVEKTSDEEQLLRHDDYEIVHHGEFSEIKETAETTKSIDATEISVLSDHKPRERFTVSEGSVHPMPGNVKEESPEAEEYEYGDTTVVYTKVKMWDEMTDEMRRQEERMSSTFDAYDIITSTDVGENKSDQLTLSVAETSDVHVTIEGDFEIVHTKPGPTAVDRQQVSGLAESTDRFTAEQAQESAKVTLSSSASEVLSEDVDIKSGKRRDDEEYSTFDEWYVVERKSTSETETAGQEHDRESSRQIPDETREEETGFSDEYETSSAVGFVETRTTTVGKKTRVVRSINEFGEITERLVDYDAGGSDNEDELAVCGLDDEELFRDSDEDDDGGQRQTLAVPTIVGGGSDLSDQPGSITVFTSTIEGEPEVETEMDEYEDFLPDGTTVRRKVTTTRRRQTYTKRVLLEGLDDDEVMLGELDESRQFGPIGSDSRMRSPSPTIGLLDEALALRSPTGSRPSSADTGGSVGGRLCHNLTRYSDRSCTEPEMSTEIELEEEKTDDGRPVRRRTTTKRRQQLVTERLVVTGDRLFDASASDDEDVFESLKRVGSPAPPRRSTTEDERSSTPTSPASASRPS